LVDDKFSDEKLFELFCDNIYKPDPLLQEWLSNLEEMESE
jgi:hypothetical protein